MWCPGCQSDDVYRSRSQNKLLYRFLFVAIFRCHNCTLLFMRSTFLHSVRFLLSARYREEVYWNDLGTGTHVECHIPSEYVHMSSQHHFGHAQPLRSSRTVVKDLH